MSCVAPHPLPGLVSRLALTVRLGGFLVLALLAQPFAHAKVRWDPVPPADLASQDSVSAPGTDTEILFSRHTLRGSYTENQVRAKVYTKKGVETITTLSIDHGWNGEISDLAARVVKSNGAMTELKKTDFHETVLWKRGQAESRRTTLAFPNLEPGDVVEYRWQQEVPRLAFSYYRTFCQAENVFTREFSFEVKKADYDFNIVWTNCPTAAFDAKTQTIVIRNIPPFVPEPQMPPEGEFRGAITVLFMHPWMRLLGFSADWAVVGPVVAESFSKDIAPPKAVRAKAVELTAGATNPTDSVARLYRFVQSEIRNLDTDTSAAVAAAKKKRQRTEEAQTPLQTLERRTGNTWDISLLFASLVRGIGFDTRLGMSGDREQLLNINTTNGWIMADRRIVVVNFGERFGYYTPGESFVPCGLLKAKDEGAMVYICGETDSHWAFTPVATPEQTQVHRRGHFTLDEDGTLEGNVEIELTGHRAIDARETYRGMSADEALKTLRERLVARLSTAEPADLTWSNLEDNAAPFLFRYKVRVPGYGDAAGARLIFPLNFFTANAPVTFTSETRRYPIFLGITEEVRDDIELVVPEGMVLDGASAPPRVGDASSIIGSNYHVEYRAKAHTLLYRREETIGLGGAVTLTVESYAAVRRIFDRIHQADAHQLVLRSKAAPPVAENSAVPPATSAP